MCSLVASYLGLRSYLYVDSPSLNVILFQDVQSAYNRQLENDTPTARRDLVRSIFAAIDGLVWQYRLFVKDILEDNGLLEPSEELALLDKTYTVAKDGDVSLQARFLPILSAIRLTSKLAQRASPELQIDFGAQGWQFFQDAAAIRNRITHPKTASDLTISDEELSLCLEGFYWACETITQGMDASLELSRKEAANLLAFSKKLMSGDPETLAVYGAIRRYLRSDD